MPCTLLKMLLTYCNTCGFCKLSMPRMHKSILIFIFRVNATTLVVLELYVGEVRMRMMLPWEEQVRRTKHLSSYLAFDSQ